MRESIESATRNPSFTRESVRFASGRATCGAWLYRPNGVARPPIVVMGHGFGAEKSFGLPAYAELFASHGLAVLLFDYRHFGESEGKPRQLICHRQQQADWQAAITFAQSLPGVDGTRIGLWGTSYGGGHVILAAARRAEVKAIVAQVPMVDVPASLRMFPIRYVVGATFRGLRDMSRRWIGRSPYMVPIFGPPDRFAVLNLPGCDEGYRAILPISGSNVESTWKNETPARCLLNSLSFRPGRIAGRVRCPALIILAEQDQLIPPSTIRTAARRMKQSEIISWPGDHFAPYTLSSFAQLAPRQAEFLRFSLG